MTDETTPTNAQDRLRLLTPEERESCRKMAEGVAPYSRYALALLALDQGVTQAEAGELAGLTRGQVRYWRDKFIRERLDIFPEKPPRPEDKANLQSDHTSERPEEQEEDSSSQTKPRDRKKKKRKDKKRAKAKGGKKPKKAQRRKNRPKKEKKKKKKKKAKGKKRQSAKTGKQDKKKKDKKKKPKRKKK